MSAVARPRAGRRLRRAARCSASVDFEAGPGRARVRARPQRRRQDHALPGAHRRARAARRDRSRSAAPPGLRRPDRAHAPRLPGERARRGADGRARRAGAGGCRPAAPTATPPARRSARVGLDDQAEHPLRRALRRPAPARARSPARSSGLAGAAARRAARRRRPRQRRADHDACSPSCATRAARCWCPPTTWRARAHFDLVLCLNRRQVAFGPPAEVLGREVLERTYGSEIVVLERRRRAAARDRRPAPRALMDLLDLIARPVALRASTAARIAEVVLLGGFCGALVVLGRRATG